MRSPAQIHPLPNARENPTAPLLSRGQVPQIDIEIGVPFLNYLKEEEEEEEEEIEAVRKTD
jgi:hypothetical protein